MAAPSYDFEHALDARKGWFDVQSTLDHRAKLSANVTFDVPEGRVVHLNSAGEFEMGVSGTQMGIFLINGSGDYDVSNPGTTAGGLFMHRAITPAGYNSGLVAEGGFELVTTEFDADRTYAKNDLLTAGTSNTVSTTGGVLTNAGTAGNGKVLQYTDAACGVVSTGVEENHHGVDVLAFWTTYLPGAYA